MRHKLASQIKRPLRHDRIEKPQGLKFFKKGDMMTCKTGENLLIPVKRAIAENFTQFLRRKPFQEGHLKGPKVQEKPAVPIKFFA